MLQKYFSPQIASLIVISVIIVLAFVLSLISRKILNASIKRNSKKINTNPTNFIFLKNSISFIIFSIALIIIFYTIPTLRAIGTALFAGAGVIAVIIGFASQKAFSNIISGIFILMFKPFRINDIIEMPSVQKGVVEEITLRHTVIRNYENRRIIIPNSIISDETIINSSISDERIRKFVEFSISYESDIDLAIQIIKDEAIKHPLFIDPNEVETGKKEVIVRMISMTDFSVNLRAYIWTKNNDDAFVISCDLLKSVKKKFDNEGIEVPYPHRTIVYKTDLNK
jgi:small-conductance mechanosensitive channel